MPNKFQPKSDGYWLIAEAFLEDPSGYDTAAHCLYYSVFQAVFGWAESKNLWESYKDDCREARRKENPDKDFATEHAVAEYIVEKRNRGELHRLFRKLKAARVMADYKSSNVPESQMNPIRTNLKAINNLRQFYLQIP